MEFTVRPEGQQVMLCGPSQYPSFLFVQFDTDWAVYSNCGGCQGGWPRLKKKTDPGGVGLERSVNVHERQGGDGVAERYHVVFFADEEPHGHAPTLA